MAFRYKVIKKRNGINNKENYYASPIKAGTIGTREIAQYLADRSSLTPGDIRATLIGLAEVMETFLHQGYSVKLEDLGVFSLSATSDGYKSPEECTPRKVRAKRVCFCADPHMKKNLKKIKFERDTSSQKALQEEE